MRDIRLKGNCIWTPCRDSRFRGDDSFGILLQARTAGAQCHRAPNGTRTASYPTIVPSYYSTTVRIPAFARMTVVFIICSGSGDSIRPLSVAAALKPAARTNEEISPSFFPTCHILIFYLPPANLSQEIKTTSQMLLPSLLKESAAASPTSRCGFSSGARIRRKDRSRASR